MDIIIGAGATGLAYANFTQNDYLIFEADSAIGGYCKTIKQDGFIWDYSGHFFHFRDAKMKEMLCKAIEPSTLLNCHKHTQIKYNNCYVDFPFQKNIHQLPKEEFIDCLYDLFNKETKGYSNFLEMLYEKFGKSIAEKFLIPYNEKLYACNLNELDVEAMGRFFPYADKEDIIRNFRTHNNSSYNDTFSYPRGGAIEYIKSLESGVDHSKIRLNEQVVEINLNRKILYTTKGTYQFDNLISTIPFPQLLKLCGIEFDKSIFHWNKVLVFNLGFDSKGNDKRNNWVYFPDKNLSFYRVGYYDNIFGDNRMSLYVELGFESDAEIDIEMWKERVLADLLKSGIQRNDQHLISDHSVIMNPAYVHITAKSIESVKQYKNLLSNNQVYSIGRYGSWTYCSIEDGLFEAQALANITK